MKILRFSKFKTLYHKFCKTTSFHGFAEIESSRSIFWKTFWIVISVGAIGLTSFQVYKSVYNYLSQPKATVVGSLDSGVYYPPLHFCYWQWFFYVDWKRVVSRGYSKEAMGYAFGFLNGIFTETKFDVYNGKKLFHDIMVVNNYSSLLDFYKSIILPVPIIDVDHKNFSSYFDDVEIVYNEENTYLMLCYKVSETSMLRYFTDTSDFENKIVAFRMMDKTYKDVKDIVTPAEYTQYMLRWANRMGTYDIDTTSLINMTTFQPPMSLILFNNIAKATEIGTDNDVYSIDLHVSVYRSLDGTRSYDCNRSFREMHNNPSCINLCNAIATSEACQCVRPDQAILLQKNFSDTKICHKDMSVIKLEKPDSLKNMTLEKFFKKEHFDNCSDVNRYQLLKSDCLRSCSRGCEVWTFDKSVTVKSTYNSLKNFGVKNTTKMYIHYPTEDHVVVIEEVNMQTWEAFVGNVGGILGIWIGASVLSFVQFIYLCFCSTDISMTDAKFNFP